MPEGFAKRHISDAENRLRLLLCIDALGLCTREELWPFVAKLELMEYMPMCLYLDELLRDGSLMEGQYAVQGVLFLTGGGREALELFQRRMPRSDRDRILLAAPQYAAQLSEKRQIRTAYELADRGRYRLSCSVTEGEHPTLFLRIDTDSKRLCEAASRHFRQGAARLITRLYTLPPAAEAVQPRRTDNLEEALKTARPGEPSLCLFGGQEAAGAVCLHTGKTKLFLSLLLGREQDARQWLASVEHTEGLAEELTAMLREGQA